MHEKRKLKFCGIQFTQIREALITHELFTKQYGKFTSSKKLNLNTKLEKLRYEENQKFKKLKQTIGPEFYENLTNFVAEWIEESPNHEIALACFDYENCKIFKKNKLEDVMTLYKTDKRIISIIEGGGHYHVWNGYHLSSGYLNNLWQSSTKENEKKLNHLLKRTGEGTTGYTTHNIQLRSKDTTLDYESEIYKREKINEILNVYKHSITNNPKIEIFKNPYGHLPGFEIENIIKEINKIIIEDS